MTDEQKQPEMSKDVEPLEQLEQQEHLEASEPANEGNLEQSQSEQAFSSESEVLEVLATDSGEVTEETSANEYEQMIVTLQQEIAALRQRLDSQVQQADSFKGQYVRIAADFENFRKRNQKEKEDLEYQVKRNTIMELLSAIDSFERARVQIKPNNDGELAIHKSYQGVYKQLVDALKRIGVSSMRPEGEPFDPNLHEAVYREATTEYEEGVVIEQLVRGYLLGDRVLRHAMVKVAAPKEDAETNDESISSEVSTTTDTTTESGDN